MSVVAIRANASSKPIGELKYSIERHYAVLATFHQKPNRLALHHTLKGGDHGIN